MKVTRRRFMQLGAAAGSAALLSGGALQAAADDLVTNGRDVAGGKEHEKGEQRNFTPTTCVNCGVTDGILAFTEGEGKSKRIVKLEGNPKHPNCRGKICAKGQAGLQLVYDPFRIRYPMMRDPEKRGDPKAWKRISYEQAIDEVAKRLTDIRKSGDIGSFVYHTGRDRFGEFTKRWVKATGSKHNMNHTSICESSLKAGYETTFGQDMDIPDVLNAKYMIFVGDNIFEASYMHNALAQRISDARFGPNAAKLVAIDPRLSQTAGAADEWLAPRPGTDAAILLAMCHVIMRENLHDAAFLDEWTNYPTAKLKKYLKPFTPEWAEEQCGVEATKIERIAIEFGSSQPGFVRAYNGLSNSTNGTYNARCVALVNAIVGNIDKPGGFCLMKDTAFGKLEPEPKEDDIIEELGMKGEFPFLEFQEEKFPLAHHGTHHLIPEMMEESKHKIELYMLHQYNPVYSNPDCKQWLDLMKDTSKIAFIVDFSPFVSETVQETVDLVIPDCTYLERMMVNKMPSVENFGFIHVFQPVIDPLYESVSLYDSLLAIAKKVPGMEKYFDYENVEAMCKALVEGKWGEGSWERLKADGALINPGGGSDPKVMPSDPAYKSYEQLTPDELAAGRKFNTFSKVLGPEDIAKLKDKESQFPKGDGPIKDKDGKKTVGVVKGGVTYKGFPSATGIWETHSHELEEHGFDPLPAYVPNATTARMGKDEFQLITGKTNVHVQSRTANIPWLMEINHYNPLWINTSDAERLGVESGDEINLQNDYGMKSVSCRAHVTEGIRPGTVFIAFSMGHWEYGPMASKGKDPFAMLPEQDFTDVEGIEKNVDAEWFTAESNVDRLADVWWHKQNIPGDARGKNPIDRETVGWLSNWICPNDVDHTDPIGGEYAWSNVPVKIVKTGSKKETAMGGIGTAMGLAVAAGAVALARSSGSPENGGGA